MEKTEIVLWHGQSKPSCAIGSRIGHSRHRSKCSILDGWSIVDQLHAVDVPTLTTNGRYDIAQDYVVRAYHENIPGAKWVRFENSSHMPFWEERARYMEVLRRFLESDLDV